MLRNSDEYYEEIAKKVGNDMINYEKNDDSYLTAFNKCLSKYGDFNYQEANKILHFFARFIAVLGYTIEEIEPFRLKHYLSD